MQAGNWLAGDSSAERECGVSADSKLNMSQQSALAAEKTSHRLGCLTRAQAAEKLLILPALCTQEAAERTLHLVL